MDSNFGNGDNSGTLAGTLPGIQVTLASDGEGCATSSSCNGPDQTQNFDSDYCVCVWVCVCVCGLFIPSGVNDLMETSAGFDYEEICKQRTKQACWLIYSSGPSWFGARVSTTA